MLEYLCNDCDYEWVAHEMDICPKCESDNVEEVYVDEEEDE